MSQGRRKGATSSTPVERTRAQIDKLLREWGCKRIGWQDNFEDGIVEVAFVFLGESGEPLCAKFEIYLDVDDPTLTTDKKIEADQRGRFRTLFYWLQGALDAIDAGIIPAEQLFLPWITDSQGQTFYEAVRPKIDQLNSGEIRLQLGTGVK